MDLYTYNVIIARVVDGDTVDVDIDLGFDVILRNQRVRLLGVDTPECRTTDLQEKEAGLLAKDVVMKFLPEGTKCIIKTEYDNNDKFGRILGTFFIKQNDKDFNINQYLIENNYAVAYYGQNKALVEAAHLKNYSILRERGELDGQIS